MPRIAEFRTKLCALESEYTSISPVRADGNCFYRAYLYGILKSAIECDKLEYWRAECASLASFCKSMGYDAFAVDEFHELLDEQLELLMAKPSLDTLTNEVFSDASVDGYMIAFMRCVCGSALKKWHEDFTPFLPSEYHTIEDFCRKEVDPMYRDCDQLQIVALTKIFHVPAKVIYLDRSEGERCTEHVIGEEYVVVTNEKNLPSFDVTVLYRPGHYDVLNR